MITKEAILKVVEEYSNMHGLFVVEVSVKKDNRVTVYIDSVNGLNLNDCIMLSRQIESKFDKEEEDYSLEVSSPGLEYPLTLPQQFEKNLNRELNILLKSGPPVSGVLRSYTSESLGIEYEKVTREGKKKHKETVIENISLSNIKQAKIKVVIK